MQRESDRKEMQRKNGRVREKESGNRKTIHRGIQCGGRIFVLLCLALGLLTPGMVVRQRVLAAAGDIAVNIPYNQAWQNHTSAPGVKDTFAYALSPADGDAPAAAESGGDGIYRFSLTGTTSGNLELHFPFERPGYYYYNVYPDAGNPSEGYVYRMSATKPAGISYTIMIMVMNDSEGGLRLAAAGPSVIRDQWGDKYMSLDMLADYYESEAAPTPAPTSTPTPAVTRVPVPTVAAAPVPVITTPAPQATATPTPTPTPTPEPEEIGEEEVPLAGIPGEDFWALLNLLAMIVTVAIAVFEAVIFFRKGKKDEKQVPAEAADGMAETEEEKTSRIRLRLVTIVPAIASVVLFLLTEDIRLPMHWTDEWTIWMIIILIINAAFAIIAKTMKKKTSESGEGGA